MSPNNIYVDIDGVVARKPEDAEGPYDYSKAGPITRNIRKINRLYDQGHTIVYWTARGTVTGIDWEDVTRDQLDRWGCKYHSLVMGKPAFDVFIDDKAFNVDALEHVMSSIYGMKG